MLLVVFLIGTCLCWLPARGTLLQFVLMYAQLARLSRVDCRLNFCVELRVWVYINLAVCICFIMLRKVLFVGREFGTLHASNFGIFMFLVVFIIESCLWLIDRGVYITCSLFYSKSFVASLLSCGQLFRVYFMVSLGLCVFCVSHCALSRHGACRFCLLLGCSGYVENLEFP